MEQKPQIQPKQQEPDYSAMMREWEKQDQLVRSLSPFYKKEMGMSDKELYDYFSLM